MVLVTGRVLPELYCLRCMVRAKWSLYEPNSASKNSCRPYFDLLIMLFVHCRRFALLAEAKCRLQDLRSTCLEVLVAEADQEEEEKETKNEELMHAALGKIKTRP